MEKPMLVSIDEVTGTLPIKSQPVYEYVDDGIRTMMPEKQVVNVTFDEPMVIKANPFVHPMMKYGLLK